MKPLTMSEEREALVRETHGECNLHRKECGAFDMLAEVDALRAKLAEVEAERDAATIRAHLVDVAAEHESAFNLTSLAASQARERGLREAGTEVVKAQDNFDGPEDRRLGKAIQAIDELCSAPTDDSALRAVCVRVAGGIWALAAPSREMDSTACIAFVNEVLGPGAEPISAEIKEKE